MGYIAPITQFDYIQYANRTAESGEKVRIVDGTTPIQPIRFDQVLQNEAERFEQYEPFGDRGTKAEKKLEAVPESPAALQLKTELTAQMTGKGGYFNEVI